MLKNIVVLLLLSLGVVFGIRHLEPILMALVSAHDWLSQLLLQVFAGGKAGSIIRNLLSLIIIPIVAASIPTFIYWFAKRRFFPYCMHVVWIVWLLQTTAIVALYHVTL